MSKKLTVNSPSCLYVFDSNCIGDIEGQILTFIDAIVSDPVQRKAAKDMLRPMIWTWASNWNVVNNYEIKKIELSVPMVD